MSSTYGENLKLSIFGQSHGAAIGMTLDGIPAGLPVDMQKLQQFLSRRAPGQGAYATARKEADAPEFLSGLVADVTCGAPIAAIIPPAATSSALIYVGVIMLAGLKNIDLENFEESVPVGLMLIAMPISSSIGHAIGLGLIAYTFIKVFTGGAKEVSVLTYIISLLFLVKFFLVA